MKQVVFFLLGIVIVFLVANWIFFSFDQVEKLNLTINRFEQELFLINKDNVIEKSNQFNTEFGSFNEFFTAQILQISSFKKEDYYNALLAFSQDKDMREAYDSTALAFSDFSDIQLDLELAFGRFATSFPSFPIPEITTFFGGFNYGVVTYDNHIAIGLENFLGKGSKFYKYLGDPKYLRFQKQRRFISSNVMEVWFNENFQKYLVGRDFLSQMIHRGKMMYFLNVMLPETDMADKLRFNLKQMDWVEENEASIWEYFIQEDLLFSKKASKFRSFINYAPFAKGMPKEAPGRVAYFIGYRIVNSYMENNKIDIRELMSLTDSRQFLQDSRYKPNK